MSLFVLSRRKRQTYSGDRCLRPSPFPPSYEQVTESKGLGPGPGSRGPFRVNIPTRTPGTTGRVSGGTRRWREVLERKTDFSGPVQGTGPESLIKRSGCKTKEGKVRPSPRYLGGVGVGGTPEDLRRQQKGGKDRPEPKRRRRTCESLLCRRLDCPGAVHTGGHAS